MGKAQDGFKYIFNSSGSVNHTCMSRSKLRQNELCTRIMQVLCSRGGRDLTTVCHSLVGQRRASMFTL